MALSLDTLKGGLLRGWLPGERGPWAASARESGDHFAAAVVQWFGAAQAATAPCVTVAAKQQPLAAGAAAAFEARSAQAAGMMLAQAVGAYLAGHTFVAPGVTTAGTSAPPLALASAGAALTAVFADVNLSLDARAQRVAAACTTLATTTLVAFVPSPVPPPICPPPSFVS